MKLSGLEPVSIGADNLFVNIGERTNVTGSRPDSFIGGTAGIREEDTDSP